LTRRLHELNPAAPISRIRDGIVDPDTLFGVGLIDRVASSQEIHDHRHDDHIHSFSVTRDQPVSPEQFAQWFERLKAIAGADLLRVKGFVNVAGQHGPTVIQGVRHVFSPPVTLGAWPSADRRTRIVFITRNLDEAALRTAKNIFD
jgi:G3E family GTPase